MDISKALALSARGLQVQSTRLRAVAAAISDQDAPVPSPTAELRRREVCHSWGHLDAPRGAADLGGPSARLGSSRATPRSRSVLLGSDAGSSTEETEARSTRNANSHVVEATRLLLTRTIELLR